MDRSRSTSLHDVLTGSGSARRTRAIVFIIYLMNVALVSPVFFPSLHEIGGWDESVYINEGRELVEGTLPRFSHNPAVAALYALTYLPVQSSPYWLIHSCSIGRFVLFSLLWFASFLVATRMTGLASPFIMIALVAISPALTGLLNNGSNALFAAMAGFALWQFLAFHQTRHVKHLWLCSTFVGLAALSRNEGPVLFLVFLGLSVAFCTPKRLIVRGVTAAVVPFMVLVGGYVLIYGLRTGQFILGTAERSYITFEQGHGMAYAASYGTLQAYVEGQNDAPKLFGTAEENNYSILTAIRRNPSAYLQRIPLLTRSAIKDAFAIYKWHFAIFCFLLAGRGVLELWRTKSYGPLAILLLWPSYSVLYVLLCYQAAHLLIPFLTVLGLASVGVSAVVTNLNSRMERYMWSAAGALLAVAIVAAYRAPNDLLVAPFLLLLGFWLMWLVMDHYVGLKRSAAVACLIFLAVTLVVRLGVVHSEPRSLGSTPDERAMLYLREHFPPRTGVGAYAPGKIWTANMTHVQMVKMSDMKSFEDVWDWMERNSVEVIYADNSLRLFEPVAWDLIRRQVGQAFEVGFDDAGATPGGGDAVQVLIRRLPHPRPTS